MTEGQSTKRRQHGSRRGGLHGAAVDKTSAPVNFQLNQLADHTSSLPRLRKIRRDGLVDKTPAAGAAVSFQVKQLSDQMNKCTPMIHDDNNGDSAGKMEMLQVIPSRPTGIDDAETSMADDAVEALSPGVGDDSTAELLADIAAEMLLAVHPVGVNMRVLSVLAIGVSEQTINESRAKDKWF